MRGRPIQHTTFAEWIRGSVVVDDRARPLRVYHGSRSPYLDRFDLRAEGTGAVNIGGKKLGGIWFTSSRENALFFADSREPHLADEGSLMTYGEDPEFYTAVSDAEGGPLFQVGPYSSRNEALRAATHAACQYNLDPRRGDAVVDVYLRLVNPLVVDGVIPRKAEFERARANGHDGIIARNVVDGPIPSDIFVAFDPTQVQFADAVVPRAANVPERSGLAHCEPARTVAAPQQDMPAL